MLHPLDAPVWKSIRWLYCSYFSVTQFVLILLSINLLPGSHYRTLLTHQFVLSHQRDYNTHVLSGSRIAPHALNQKVCRTVWRILLFATAVRLLLTWVIFMCYISVCSDSIVFCSAFVVWFWWDPLWRARYASSSKGRVMWSIFRACI